MTPPGGVGLRLPPTAPRLRTRGSSRASCSAGAVGPSNRRTRLLSIQRLQRVRVGIADDLCSLVPSNRPRTRRASGTAGARSRRAGGMTTRSSLVASGGAGRRRAPPSAGRAAPRSARGAARARRAPSARPPAPARAAGDRGRADSSTASDLRNPGESDRARQTKSSTPSSATSGGTAYTCSPSSWRRSRLVTMSTWAWVPASARPR